ncbi:MAG: Thiocyanate hydrolase subunit gamma [Pelotomaculum sp. PtaB.Bin013]|uniref:NHLP leader peptide family RiPP n=1 Tax=Pelotomaculum isophthalicicum JI TaxID=947010 RepID=A0A9X4H6T3_9FIRM|nr:NHLP leader peptide family RiPP precursor [Pelotomaculum isophthalicicum]MDF9409158.1 NHLP leader peptide family RiPP precursor [Pelotomaculum isophthalicicum JI]OPX87253.1 MAG: Thiocyanate hydrolase subunit gamma [Pelotomaculum sp. PtaB.Bin013]
MSKNKQTMTLGEEVKEKIKAVVQDTDFRKALVNNPKEALAQIGIQFPEEVDIKVVESAKSESKVTYLVLPVNPDELTNEPRISKHDCRGPSLPLVVCLYCPFH